MKNNILGKWVGEKYLERSGAWKELIRGTQKLEISVRGIIMRVHWDGLTVRMR